MATNAGSSEEENKFRLFSYRKIKWAGRIAGPGNGNSPVVELISIQFKKNLCKNVF